MIPKNDFFVIFSFAACLVALLCAIVLLSFTKFNRLPNRLLAFGLIGLGLIVFTNTLNYTEIYGRFPHLFRITFPIHYIVPPVFYLYVRTALFEEKKFRKYDWLLFVFAFLHLVEYMPYYAKSASEKLVVMQNLFESPSNLAAHREGVLPPFLHPLLKAVYGLACTFFSLRLLYIRKKLSDIKVVKERTVWKWTNLLSWQLGLFYFLMLIVFSFNSSLPNLIDFVNVPIMLVLFSTALTLLYKPSVLYGIQMELRDQSLNSTENTSAILKESESKFTLTEEQMREYDSTLKTFFKEEQPFLNRNYKINMLSNDINIPVHHLSLFINQKYGLSYSSLINRARIDHILANFDIEKHQQLTLEGLAKEAGFNSRNTFIRAFKKYLGHTPSNYFQLRAQDDRA